MRKVPVAIDAGESVTAPSSLDRKRGALRLCREDVSWLTPCGIVVRCAPLGAPDRLSRPGFMDHLGDANAVVRKDPLAADRLDLMMEGMGPPGGQRGFVLPYLVGQQQVLPCQAPEAIDEEAATHRLELGLQRSGEIEILIPVPAPCLNFKEQTNHRRTFALAPSLLSAASTACLHRLESRQQTGSNNAGRGGPVPFAESGAGVFRRET